MTPEWAPPAPAPAQPTVVQAFAPSAPSVPATVPQPPPRVFIPAGALPDAPHSTPIVQTREICEKVQVEQAITLCRVPVPTTLDLLGRAVSNILRA